VCGGLGGIFSVWVFGMVFYHGDANAAGKLIILASLYAPDWSAFGTFLVAPVAGLLITFAVCALRLGVRYAVCKSRGERFDGLDRHLEPPIADEVRAELEQESSDVSHRGYGATKRV